MRAQSLAGERDVEAHAAPRRRDFDAADILDALDDAFGQREADGEILEIARRRHHHRERRAAER